ncbi:MAG: reductive dehalogenase [Anaerolineales bacterium]|nr:reductive dehalogenase [Anaerolineales bacterium]
MKSKLDRRSFIKALGVGSVGAVAAARYPREMRDIVTQANENRPKSLWDRPFWVKEVPEVTLGMGEMTDDYKRWNSVNDQFHSWAKYVGEAEAERIRTQGDKNFAEWLKQEKPGYALRDRALDNAANLVNMTSGPYGGDDTGIQSWQPMPWTMGMMAQTKELGVRYEAPPAIAARDVKAAARLFGSAITRVAELDRRLIHANHSNMRPIVFEDTEMPYSDDEKYVIPSRFNRVVVLAVRQSPETYARSPSPIGSAAVGIGYSEMSWTAGMVAEFIRGLGYHAIPAKNSFASTVAYAVISGVGELARTNRVVTPEYGGLVRLALVFTDLPLAIDSPIAAGISEFCVRCKKCAESCPSGALSYADYPSFEVPEGYQWVNPGHKAWWPAQTKCYSYWQEITTGCGICHAACPWVKKDQAWLHEMTKITAASTPIFDEFMRRMDDAFGYGVKNTDEEQLAWWDLDLPEYGMDTSQGHREV